VNAHFVPNVMEFSAQWKAAKPQGAKLAKESTSGSAMIAKASLMVIVIASIKLRGCVRLSGLKLNRFPESGGGLPRGLPPLTCEPSSVYHILSCVESSFAVPSLHLNQ